MNRILNAVKEYFTTKTKFHIFLDACYIIGSTVGAAIIASNSGNNKLGYVLFFISSVAGVLILRGSNASKSLMVVTVYFGVVNLFGFFKA